MEDTYSTGTSDANVGGSDAAPSNLTSQQDLQSSGGKYGLVFCPSIIILGINPHLQLVMI